MKNDDIRKIFELEIEALELEQAASRADQRCRQAQYDRREALEAQLNYEGFSLSAIRDRLRGRYEQQLEQHRRAVRDAEAALLHARQELERVRNKQNNNDQQRRRFPAWEAVRDWIGEDTAGLREYDALDLQLCCARLKPLLEKTREALIQSQQVFRGDTMGQIMTAEGMQLALAAPNGPAKECEKMLKRMKQTADRLEMPFEIPAYFQNPAAYLASATKFTRYDRYAEAIAQTNRLLKNI